MIHDGIHSVATQGVCPEEGWPYDISKFAQQPPRECYDKATNYKAIAYSQVVQTLSQMKGCIAAGYPFVFGFTCYESLESDEVARTGDIPMPGSTEQVIGGHCVVAVGYDDSQQKFIIRNSWGDAWGNKGYGTMPYTYILSKLASDFWTIRVVSH